MIRLATASIFLASLGLRAEEAKADPVADRALLVLEYNCLKCHCDDNGSDGMPNYTKAGNLDLTTRAAALKGGAKSKGTALVPGNGNASLICAFSSPAMEAMRGERGPAPDFKLPEGKMGMPPLGFTALSADDHKALIAWIDAGAKWERKLAYKQPPRPRIFSAKLYKDLGFETAKPLEAKTFTESIKDTELKFDMVAIPAGKFKRGSEASDDSKPVREVEISPFFIASTEVTWELYDTFLEERDAQARTAAKKDETKNDLLSAMIVRPTPSYHEMSFGMGKGKHPAICIPRLSAQAFCMWLSAKTGKFYRLPTEAEWEYACRAGTTTKYPWGDDEAKAADYAVVAENAGEKYADVGSKKPNAWGLYDMIGNAAEMTLDHYDTDFYAKGPAKDPYNLMPLNTGLNPLIEAEWPLKLYDNAIRGGSFVQNIADLGSSVRLPTSEELKKTDPQGPKSPWWFTEKDFIAVGFRVVCVPTPPKLEEVSKYWLGDAEMELAPLVKNGKLDPKYFVK